MSRIILLLFFTLSIYGQEAALKSNFITKFKVIGTSKPYRELEVIAAESGIISRLKVREGSVVKKGQVIALLDASLLLSSLKIAQTRASTKGEIQKAKIELKLARLKLKRLLKLQGADHAYTEEVDRARSGVELGSTRLLSAYEKKKVHKLEAEHIRLKIKRHMVLSPIDGVIREVIRNIGESISPVQPIFKIVQLNYLKVVAHPLFSQAIKLQLGQKVQVFFSQIKQTTIGKVIFIDPVVDAASNTVRIVVAVKNIKNNLRSGIQCVITLLPKIKKQTNKEQKLKPISKKKTKIRIKIEKKVQKRK